MKVDCLIKNIDWFDNPTEFVYKLSENSEVKKETIVSVKEFGIISVSKYIRTFVEIENSKNDEKEFKFINETIFLKVLIEGNASLYLYENKGVSKFFYSKDNGDIKQLIHKIFIKKDDNRLLRRKYRQQLWTDLACSSIKKSTVANLSYKGYDLIRYFEKYNTCNNNTYVNFVKDKQKGLFHLYVKRGISSSNLSVEYLPDSNWNYSFGYKKVYKYGAEVVYT